MSKGQFPRTKCSRVENTWRALANCPLAINCWCFSQSQQTMSIPWRCIRNIYPPVQLADVLFGCDLLMCYSSNLWQDVCVVTTQHWGPNCHSRGHQLSGHDRKIRTASFCCKKSAAPDILSRCFFGFCFETSRDDLEMSVFTSLQLLSDYQMVVSSARYQAEGLMPKKFYSLPHLKTSDFLESFRSHSCHIPLLLFLCVLCWTFACLFNTQHVATALFHHPPCTSWKDRIAGDVSEVKTLRVEKRITVWTLAVGTWIVWRHRQWCDIHSKKATYSTFHQLV